MTATAASRFRLPLYLLSVFVCFAALAAYWHMRGRALDLPGGITAAHKLQCVSYSPFAKDQSPLVPHFTVRPERIDADFALLARYTRCVRTYSMTGMAELPAIAAKHGLKVMLGAWINGNVRDTQLEIEQLVSAANRYPDVVEAVVVGNESLLRKEVSGRQLAELIAQVKARVAQPVTYADVWEFWLKHPEVAPAVDFLTIHLLPYWEDQPTGIDGALDHVAEIRERFGRQFAPKDILIGETGWPSAGRQRETAVPGLINQARFMRGFAALAERNGWRYNLIEAFDQPWKRNNEGAVGGYWGLFDADRNDKHVLAGPVSDLPEWRYWLALSAAIAVAVLLLGGRPRDVTGALLMPAVAVLGGICAGICLIVAQVGNRDLWERAWTAAVLGINAVVLLHGMLALARRGQWRGVVFAWLETRAALWLLCAGFIGAVLMLQLVFDARYREFPGSAIVLPALIYLARPPAAPRREALLLAAVMGAGIPAQLFQEGLRNAQALTWAAAAALLTLALWRGARTSLSSASSSANTAGVTV